MVGDTARSGVYERIARREILTRLFADPPSLRFGLPGTETAWQRLEATLKKVSA